MPRKRKEDLGDFYRELFLESFIRPMENATDLLPESVLIAYSSFFRAHAVFLDGLARAAEAHVKEVNARREEGDGDDEDETQSVTWKDEDAEEEGAEEAAVQT